MVDRYAPRPEDPVDLLAARIKDIERQIDGLRSRSASRLSGDGQAREFAYDTELRFTAPSVKVNGAEVITAAAVTVTGSRGGNAALASLLDQLDAIGVINDSTTA